MIFKGELHNHTGQIGFDKPSANSIPMGLSPTCPTSTGFAAADCSASQLPGSLSSDHGHYGYTSEEDGPLSQPRPQHQLRYPNGNQPFWRTLSSWS
jgi:hypothetical protein